ncbi:FG-GAP repeat domain-containing protein [Kitasatospora sp. NPDC101176]|uniref:FG-GAP repeat domain-containing protein n=1 Tax=Kitasatospora sp. NPDC101176 TaxID=3364099 RepID=UPI0038287F52
MPRKKSTPVGTAIAVVAALTALSSAPAHSVSSRAGNEGTTPAVPANNGSPTPGWAAPAGVTGPPADQDRGDTQPDLLWYDTSLNQFQIWYMDQNRIIGRGTVLLPDGSPAGLPAGWQTAGAADFNRDGVADVITHQPDSGETVIMYLDGNGHLITGHVVLDENGKTAHAGTPWQIAGAADFNQDGYPDILWHNTSTNETQIWFMKDRSIIQRQDLLEENGSPTRVGAPWRIAGVSGPGFNPYKGPDILWHNTDTGEAQTWSVDYNHRIAQRQSLYDENGNLIHVGAPWQIAGTADFDQEGIPDIVWHNTDTGETQIWNMGTSRVFSRQDVVDRNGIPTHVGAPWQIAGVANF